MCINIYLLALFSVQCSVVVLHLNYFQNAQNSSYFAMKRNRKYKSMMLRFIVLCAVPCHIVSYEMSKKKKTTQWINVYTLHRHTFYRWKFKLFPFSKNLFSSFVEIFRQQQQSFSINFVLFPFVTIDVPFHLLNRIIFGNIEYFKRNDNNNDNNDFGE